jgi:uncharacterized membrane protein YebE (DUF533 family)
MSEAKVEVLKTVLALAYADGEMSADEERLVDFLIDTNGLTPEEEQQVRAKQDGEVDLARLGTLVTDADERARAYETAALVSMMDGSQQSAESELLTKLREALSIDGSAAWEIEAKARKIYEAFTKRQQGGDDEEG